MKTVRFLFNDDTARAIVQGRKTVTRRPAVCVGWDPLGPEYDGQVTVLTNSDPRIGTQAYFHTNGSEWHGVKAPCAPGDILIGRECWGYRGTAWNLRDDDNRSTVQIAYRCDNSRADFVRFNDDGVPQQRRQKDGEEYADFERYIDRFWKSWRPSIHMPDWAARIRRRVVSVTVERLHDITEDDAVREGFEAVPVHGKWVIGGRETHWSARKSFADTWDFIYAEKGLGWDSNCWVWRIEFERENVQEVSDGR